LRKQRRLYNVTLQDLSVRSFSIEIFALLRREGAVMKTPSGWVSVSDDGLNEILTIFLRSLVKSATGPDIFSPRCA
jgi:hypothetical protein